MEWVIHLCQCNAAESWCGAKCVAQRRGRRADKVVCHRKSKEGEKRVRKVKRKTVIRRGGDRREGKGEMTR